MSLVCPPKLVWFISALKLKLFIVARAATVQGLEAVASTATVEVKTAPIMKKQHAPIEYS